MATIAQLVRCIQNGNPIDVGQQRLIAPGVTMGGARPKALLTMDGHPWVLKFNEPGEAVDLPMA